MRRVGTTFLLVFITWLALTYSVHPENLVVGAIVSLIITIICRHLLARDTPKIILHPLRWAYFLLYIAVMTKEEILSHIDVMKRVLTGNIRPAIVEIPVAFETSLGKVLLGNSITLTPGTLTVNVNDEKRFFIHTIGYRKDHKIGKTISSFGRRVIT
jgi:multicomponent Na+:H+ antiporter subunit E